jgi:hypothetical protein
LMAATAVIVGVLLVLTLLYRRNKRLALWCGAGIGIFLVGGNALEKLVTGQSGLF